MYSVIAYVQVDGKKCEEVIFTSLLVQTAWEFEMAFSPMVDDLERYFGTNTRPFKMGEEIGMIFPASP